MRKKIGKFIKRKPFDITKVEDALTLLEELKYSIEYHRLYKTFVRTKDWVGFYRALEETVHWDDIHQKAFNGMSEEEMQDMAALMQEDIKNVSYCDNYLFQTVMSHKDICRIFIEEVLGISVEIQHINKEYAIQSARYIHGVRLDVCVKLSDGRMVDIEMQVASQEYLFQRMLFYRSNITMDMLHRGGDKEVPYYRLHPTIIIFVCAFQPNVVGNRILTVFEGVAQHDKTMKNPYMGKDVILNLLGTTGDISSELSEFKDVLVSDGTVSFSSNNELCSLYREYAKSIQNNDEWKVRKMSWNLVKADAYAKGKAEATNSLLVKMLQGRKIRYDSIAESFEKSMDEITAKAKSLGVYDPKLAN